MGGNREIRIFEAGNRPAAFDRLWARVFEDEQVLIDGFFLNFPGEISAYGLYEGERLLSGLTQFRMGDLVAPGEEGGPAGGTLLAPALVSYAICTDPAARGRGAGAAITAFAAERAQAAGAVSVLSPAEESLVDFYRPIGYQPFFQVRTGMVMAGREAPAGAPAAGESPEVHFEKIPAADYQAVREDLLRDRPHIRLSPRALELVRLFSAGEDSLYLVNEGEACAVLGEEEEGRPLLQEVLVRPGSPLTAMKIARAAIDRFGLQACFWRAPVRSERKEGGRAPEKVRTQTQGMILGPADLEAALAEAAKGPYFGFPFD